MECKDFPLISEQVGIIPMANVVLSPGPSGVGQRIPCSLLPPAGKTTPPKKVVCIIKKPCATINSSSRAEFEAAKIPRYESYSQVKVKEVRPPTIADLANQKDIADRVSGWKIGKLTGQMQIVADAESDIVKHLSTLLDQLESKAGPNPDPEISRIIELLKINIQKGSAIREHMINARAQTSRFLDEHKPRVMDILTEYMSKKAAKKKDRLWKVEGQLLN